MCSFTSATVLLRPSQPGRRQRFHGHMPSISTSSEKLRTIRMSTITEHGDALDDGSTMIVRTMSAR